MMKILIIDIETTGFLNDNGKIVEIGAVELCLETGSKKIIFDVILDPHIEVIKLAKSWIVTEGYIKVAEIIRGVTFESIKDDLQFIFDLYEGATAYNRRFDFDFLESYGMALPKKLPCPMLKSTPLCKLEKTGYAACYGGYKWPKVEEAYKYFFPKSKYVELHRGADDAFHEADIVFALHKIKKFL